jgi:hypothetical protein
MLCKFKLFIFGIFTLISVHVYSQDADTIITNSLLNKDYIGLEKQFPIIENDVKNSTLKLVSKTILDTRFNRPYDALNTIDTLLMKHQTKLNVNQLIELCYTKLTVLEELQEYNLAYAELQNFVKQLGTYFSNDDLVKFHALQKHLFYLKDEQKIQIIKPLADTQIPFGKIEFVDNDKNNTVSNIITTVGAVRIKINGKEFIFLFDTGSEKTIIFNHLTDLINLKKTEGIYNILGIGALEKGSLAILLDELSLGEIKFKNLPVLISDNYLKKLFPDIKGDLNVIGGIIGIDVIKKLGEIQICPKERKIIVPFIESELPQFGKNIIFDSMNNLTVQGILNGTQLINLQFDTGSSITRLFEPYYLRYQKDIESKYEKRIYSDFSIEFQKNEVYLLPSSQLKIGDSEVLMNNIPIYTKILHQSNPEIDGLLGLDFVVNQSKIILNTNKMFFCIR